MIQVKNVKAQLIGGVNQNSPRLLKIPKHISNQLKVAKNGSNGVHEYNPAEQSR